MRKAFSIVFLLFGFIQWCSGQNSLYHIGNLYMAPDAQVGVHTDWINDAPLEDGFGLVGFYGDRPMELTGAFPLVLFDAELFNQAGLDLGISLFIINGFDFFEGDIRTPRTDLSINAFYERNSFLQGSTDQSKVNGQVSFAQKSVFNAPTGTLNRLRSVDFNFGAFTSNGSATYFSENPSFPLSLNEGFNTASFAPSLDAVSSLEFWLIDAAGTAALTVNWDPNSALSSLTANVDAITVVGWNSLIRQWVPLPVQNRSGTLDEGFITTGPVIPDQFSVLTFGVLNEPDEVLTLDNYFLSPNGDNVNDRLVIEELLQSPNNRLVIFNRAGLKVFELDNYTNEFDGNANTGSTFYGTDIGLPEGVYYYIAKLNDLQLNFQGFLFLDR